MKLVDEQLKEITLYETPETDEALKLLTNKKRQLLWMKIIAIISGISAFYSFALTVLVQMVMPTILFAIFSIILIGTYKSKIRPYRTLYSIASHNDRIRNDEHIRFKERQRLEKGNSNDKPLTEELIDHSVENIGLKEIDNKTLNKKIKSDKKFIPPKKGD